MPIAVDWKPYSPPRLPTPALISNVEMSRPITPLIPDSAYQAVRLLVRLHGYPIGYIDWVGNPTIGEISRERILARLDQAAIARIISHLNADRAQQELTLLPDDISLQEALDLAELTFATCPRLHARPESPQVTVAVCTHDRAYSIGRTLESLRQQSYPNLEVLVIDNRPSSDSTEWLVRTRYPDFHYIREDRIGLDWARNRAISEARSEIIAFIDDDTIADPLWAQALVSAFDTPDVMCVTGLVAPVSLEAEAEELFERYGYSKSFYRLRFTMKAPPPGRAFPYKGYLGTGCNCAFRRSVFDRVGLFDLRLDMGTPVPGGGDHDMFARIIKAGFTLVYDPGPVVSHHHVADLPMLVRKLGHYQRAYIAYLTKHILADREYALDLIVLLGWWNLRKFVRGLGGVLIKRDRPIMLVFNILFNLWLGPIAFFHSHLRAKANRGLMQVDIAGRTSGQFAPIKVIDIDLSQPIENISGLPDYSAIYVLVRLHGTPLGSIHLPLTAGQCSASIINATILAKCGPAIKEYLKRAQGGDGFQPDTLSIADLARIALPRYNNALPTVTVAICTRDRPKQLAQCLESLSRLHYSPLEICVIDNAPSSEATRQLVQSAYSNVRYLRELRPGLSYARNRAILEAQGQIIAFTDDDVIVDADWTRAIALLFAQHPDIMAVTGLVMPYELVTEAQVLFEQHGGFGRGFERTWHRGSAPDAKSQPWYHGPGRCGTGANMSFCRSLFDHIGPFDTALGTGTPTHGGEDIEMFFRIIHEGYTLVYEPAALVRHRHRLTYDELRLQIAGNGFAMSSYLMRSTLAYPNEGARFLHIGFRHLWKWHIKRLVKSFLGYYRLPRDLIFAELEGYIRGIGRYHQARRMSAQLIETVGPPAKDVLSEPRPLLSAQAIGDRLTGPLPGSENDLLEDIERGSKL